MEEAQKRSLKEAVNHPEAESKIYVAESSDGLFLGYIQLGVHIDSFTKIQQGFIESIAVTSRGKRNRKIFIEICRRLGEKARIRNTSFICPC